MRKISYLIIVINFVLGLISCDDSLGYDPNVRITRNEGEGPGPGPGPNLAKFKVDSVSYYFKESDDVTNSMWDKPFVWKYKKNKAEFYLDTTYADTEFWAELDLESSEPDRVHIDSGRIDRVTRFEFSLNTYLTDPTIYLNDKEPDKHWMKIYIKDMEHEKIYEYNGSTNYWPPTFSIIENSRSKGILKFSISFYIYTREKFRVRNFVGYITLYYKKL